MELKNVSVIGLGALGVLFGHHLSGHMPEENLRIIADRDRIARYEREQIYCNNERCTFHYVTPEEVCEKADLLIFAVKFNQLEQAIAAVKHHVGANTIILSLLNGISSEAMIGQAYGMEKVLDCVAQGMDAVKVGNRLTYQHMGMLCIGDGNASGITQKAERVSRFFYEVEIPHEVDTNMKKRLWGKFMLNVGVNQTVAVCESNYGGVQREGPSRDRMIAAMREVITLSEKEGVNLTEDDLRYWLVVMSNLAPEGKPSMLQDLEAKRYSEVELFAGAVLTLGKKHGLSSPVNQLLYDTIKAIESRY